MPSATAEIPAQIPSARACCSAGKAWQTIASESGSIGAAPSPCSNRPQISVSWSSAVAGDHRTEGEEGHPDEEQPLAAEHVAEPPTGDDEAR